MADTDNATETKPCSCGGHLLKSVGVMVVSLVLAHWLIKRFFP